MAASGAPSSLSGRFERQRHPLDPDGEADARDGGAAERLDQTVVAPAGDHGTLRADGLEIASKVVRV